MSSKFVEYSLGLLKQNGFRTTRSRLEVLEQLARTQVPLNPYTLADQLKSSGEKVDVSTIYRIFEVLKSLSLIHFVKNSQGYMPCLEFSCHESSHCHHQFVCEGCDKVLEVHLDDRNFIDAFKAKFSSFTVKSHYFEFSGLCADCS